MERSSVEFSSSSNCRRQLPERQAQARLCPPQHDWSTGHRKGQMIERQRKMAATQSDKVTGFAAIPKS